MAESELNFAHGSNTDNLNGVQVHARLAMAPSCSKVFALMPGREDSTAAMRCCRSDLKPTDMSPGGGVHPSAGALVKGQYPDISRTLEDPAGI